MERLCLDERVKFLTRVSPLSAPPLFSALGFLIASCLCSPAEAQIVWRGDFETNTLNQWSGLNNGTGIQVTDELVLEGDHAGLIQITDDEAHIWSNGLNRVEFRYAPGAQATAEGQDFYFGWSFLLPELFTEDSHQIGYFESDKTWQQMMSFLVEGSTLSFVTRQPSNQVHWSTSELQANTWYDLAMHIHWSQDQNLGTVSVWLDGEPVVQEASARTLNDANAHFIQLGILRDTIEQDESIVIDNARQGTRMEDVLNTRVPESGALPIGGAPGENLDDGSIKSLEGGCAVAPSALGGRAPFFVWGLSLLTLLVLLRSRTSRSELT
jgi:hypothetical protein